MIVNVDRSYRYDKLFVPFQIPKFKTQNNNGKYKPN